MSTSALVGVLGRHLEYQYYEPPIRKAAAVVVMLHEGLGSVAMWKDFPARLAEATGARTLAYSRFGYGRSDPLPAPYGALEMHAREAQVLAQLLEALGIERPVLFGHSDGASIALLHAAAARAEVHGVVALAPHLFVEDMCIEAIEAARATYLASSLRQRLAPYHDDPDRAFWGWNNVWLDPAFRAWNIERQVATVACPVMGIQGHQDEYGTMEQLDRLASAVRETALVRLEDCRHSPHRDQPAAVLREVTGWLEGLK